MKSHAGDNPYLCALCNQELISRNYLQRHMKGHAMDNPYPCALCFKEFISINHPKRHINRNNGKFHITFFLYPRNWFARENFFSVQLLQEIFSFGNVISRQKNIMGIPCYQKFATHNCFLLVKTGSKLFV